MNVDLVNKWACYLLKIIWRVMKMKLLTMEEARKRVEQDYEYIKKYHLTAGTMSSIKKFYDYKVYWLSAPDTFESVFSKCCFQEAHADLKVECSSGRISSALLIEIADFLRKGD